MILAVLLSFLLGAQDTAAGRFDWSMPVKAWAPAEGRFEEGTEQWNLVLFFSPGCGHCHKAWPVVEEWQKRYGKRGLRIKAVATGFATAEDLDFFRQDMGGSFVFPVFHDSSKALAARLGIKSIPAFFLVDPQGNVRSWVGSYPSTLREVESTIARQFRWRRNSLR